MAEVGSAVVVMATEADAEGEEDCAYKVNSLPSKTFMVAIYPWYQLESVKLAMKLAEQVNGGCKETR